MPTTRPATVPEIAAAVVEILAQRGPLTTEELLDATAELGVDLGVDSRATLEHVVFLDDTDTVLLDDGRHAYLRALLEGRVLTHRLSELEIAHDLVAVVPDFEPMSLLSEREPFGSLGDIGELVEVVAGYDDELLDARGVPPEAVPDDLGWLLPAGYLTGLGAVPGRLLAFRVIDAGWSVELLDDGELDAAETANVAAMLEATLGDDEPDDVGSVFWSAFAADATLLRRPATPLAELCDELGVARSGSRVAAPGFDFEQWQLERRVATISERHGISDDEALTVVLLTRFHELSAAMLDRATDDVDDELPEHGTVARDDESGETTDSDSSGDDAEGDDLDRPVIVAALRLLESPDVADALRVETIGWSADGAAALGWFADWIEPSAPPEARAALCWLRAKACERLGLISEAEADLHAALGHDPDWSPALLDLANYASDRGDADGGLALLGRAGASPDDALGEVLRAFRPRARPGLGRNDRCWCGSGRKYKQCHLGREQLPIEERAAWLYQKAGFFLQDGPFRSQIIDVASTRSEHWESETRLLEALRDSLVTDAMLFEGGVFERFVAERGDLLPDDERMLAEQWLLAERSVFEIESTTPGAGIAVRDVRTGDRCDVRERTFSRHARVGELICARIVPAGDTMQIFGGIEPVDLRLRDELVALLDEEPDPDELVELLSARFAPPTLSNTEGDPLVFCEVTLRVPDPAALAAELDSRVTRQEVASGDDPASREWIEHVTTHGMERIRATVRLTGDVATIDVNSNERADRMIEVLRILQPAIEVLEDRRTPAADLREAMSRSSSPPGPSDLDPNDPQIAAALESFARASEAAWLDESIPALRGLTPRQAAADPTHRDDLVRLLEEFAGFTGPGLMDVARLRDALGV